TFAVRQQTLILLIANGQHKPFFEIITPHIAGLLDRDHDRRVGNVGLYALVEVFGKHVPYKEMRIRKLKNGRVRKLVREFEFSVRDLEFSARGHGVVPAKLLGNGRWHLRSEEGGIRLTHKRLATGEFDETRHEDGAYRLQDR